MVFPRFGCDTIPFLCFYPQFSSNLHILPTVLTPNILSSSGHPAFHPSSIKFSHPLPWHAPNMSSPRLVTLIWVWVKTSWTTGWLVYVSIHHPIIGVPNFDPYPYTIPIHSLIPGLLKDTIISADAARHSNAAPKASTPWAPWPSPEISARLSRTVPSVVATTWDFGWDLGWFHHFNDIL